MISPVCRSCGAPIRWAVNAKSRRVPLNADPDPQGNIWLEGPNGAEPIACYVTLIDKPPSGVTKLYKSHFATCPQSAEWRKGKEKRR